MTKFPQKFAQRFLGAAIRVVTLALFLLVFTAGAALAQTKAYVSNANGDSVSVIDTATNTVIATVPVGGGPEAPVEVAAPLGRADDGVQPDHLTPQPPLATPARGADDLIQRHEPVAVAAPNAQPVPQRGQELPPPGPKKVILDVHLKESGSPHLILHHRHPWPH